MAKDEEIERAAAEVLEVHRLRALPVDPFEIARLEGIELLPGSYDGCFDGRIEYRRRSGQGRFYLLYAEEDPPARPSGRVRFSIAHELGHFYLDEHRKYLLSGVWHGSQAGFVSEKRTEREADLFAVSLLLPRAQFEERVAARSGGVCSLGELSRLAEVTFKTSLTSTAIRYAELNFEPCCVVLSRKDRVLFSMASEDIRSLCLGWLERGTPVPATSVTGRLLAARASEGDLEEREEGAVESDVWFADRLQRELWEEARILGRTGLTLTFLSLEVDEEDDEE